MSQNNFKYPGKRENSAVFFLGNEAFYSAWRRQKLENFPAARNESIVTVQDMGNPTSSEISQIVNHCQKANLAIYDSQSSILPDTLKSFCSTLGLQSTENHRSSEKSGVVAIEQTMSGGKGGYIPYTNKPLSWHTDGYYNARKDRIRAMVLHCVRDASEGGINEFLDPEIAYIRLRDENPGFITALMHPRAMTIPANQDERSAYRPVSVGPVFEIDEQSGNLLMRFSARGRNIIWRDDAKTDEARAFLAHILENDPLIVRHKLQSGQGIISNNVLHNRTGFVDANTADDKRLLYRVRYKERVQPAADRLI